MAFPESSQPLIEIRGLHNRFGRKLVHEELELSINRGEIVAIIGPSGCGKTTLLRSIFDASETYSRGYSSFWYKRR